MGNTFNRNAEDGLIQVFTFQSARYTSYLYGSFTVNIGVYVPCMAQAEGYAPTGKAIHEYHCQIRERLSCIGKRRKDHWWKLDKNAPASGKEITETLQNYGVPFLDQYRTHASIVEAVTRGIDLPLCNTPRSALIAAVVARHSGNSESATDLFTRARQTDHKGFLAHVAKLEAMQASQ